MKKLTTTTQRSPVSPEEVTMLQEVLAEVNACFMAFMHNCDVPFFEDVLHAADPIVGNDMDRKRFAAKVADCNRMVAFVTFIRNGVMADITFCRGKEVVEAIAFMLDGDSGGMLRVP